jgi:hypothetical protein
MAWARIQGRRGRTILPTDIFLFAFLALGVAVGSSAATNNRISGVVFTIVWITAAMTRLTEFRRGERPALQLNCLNPRTAAILVVGSGPWLLLGLLQSAYPSSIVWKPIEVPPLLGALGIALTIAVIVEPFLHSLRMSALAGQADRFAGSTHEYRFSSSMIIRSGAILLLSGSPKFALMCALWLGVTLWPFATLVGEPAPADCRQ